MSKISACEYYAKLDTLLAEVPEEFRAAIRNLAWNANYSGGYERVIESVSDYVDMLKPCIEDYYIRIKQG
jgi:hypothetical protein